MYRLTGAIYIKMQEKLRNTKHEIIQEVLIRNHLEPYEKEYCRLEEY